MFSDARLTSAFESLFSLIDVPPLQVAPIQQHLPTPQRAQRSELFHLCGAAAIVAAVVILILPRIAPALTETIEAQIQAILRWKAPPPAPRSVWTAMRSVTVTLPVAQSHVKFRIIVPTGLPGDVISQKVYAAPPGVYSSATHSWSLGTPIVTFVYRRANGRSFSLVADRFDPRSALPSKYIFEDMDRASNGHEVIIRRDKFTWRNGDQVMTAIAGEGIDAAEIGAIRSAMRGTPIPGVWPSRNGPFVKYYRIP